jgi:hypothetical protein
VAVPDYFARNAVAIAQAISGLDEDRLASALRGVRVGITLGRDAKSKEGKALADMLIRLVARLYPTLVISGESGDGVADSARELARRINPQVEFAGVPTIEIVVGSARLQPGSPQRIFVGSRGSTAAISTSEAQPCADTDIPFGPGVAACLAAANLFRHVFLPESRLDSNATFDVLDSSEEGRRSVTTLPPLSADFVLAGCGAIGNAAAWALARTAITGTLTLVDHQAIDLGNLQRYVLAERSDEGSSKPVVAARYFTNSLRATAYENDLASYLEAVEHRVERLLLALDSARDRRAAQASLPRWVANGWTQPGDLGVSTHDFLSGACVSCLYLPERAAMNEDAIIAEAFGVPSRVMQIRLLLHRNDGAPRDLLEAIAAARDIPLDRLLPFEGRSVRNLYSEGFCGGAVLPLSRIGAPRTEVHVPLAHQSALAGVLLAAAAVRHELGMTNGSCVTQLDLLRPLPPSRLRPVAKDPRGICICQDPDYRDVYAGKFADTILAKQRLPGRKKASTVARDRPRKTKKRG